MRRAAEAAKNEEEITKLHRVASGLYLAHIKKKKSRGGRAFFRACARFCGVARSYEQGEKI